MALDDETNLGQTIALLAQWASVLRCQAAFFGKPGGWRYVRHAQEVSESNHEQHPDDPAANLDLGLTLWSSARFAQTEVQFYELSQRAEERIRAAHEANYAVATLCLARLFRQTYRPAQAIAAFRDFAQREPRVRMVYPDCHIVGEAAVMLLHHEVENSDRALCLSWTNELLSSAVEAGYSNARVLVALARIRHALGDKVASSYFLRELMPHGSVDWKLAVDIARVAIRDHDEDKLHTAFALGITDGLVWNSLATFVKDSEGDQDLALALYDVAAQLSPGSPAVHTNIARLLLDRENADDLPRIKHHLDRAGIHADFSFRWWRPLRNTLETRLTGLIVPEKGYTPKHDRESLNRLYREFLKLSGDDFDAHKRGHAFQVLFQRLLKLTFGTGQAAGSLSLRGNQSDASFVYSSIVYRAEISWDNIPNDRSEVHKLIARLRQTASARGLLVSMSGFTSGLMLEIGNERPNFVILTLDGQEIKRVLNGSARLESLIDAKLTHYFLSSFS